MKRQSRDTDSKKQILRKLLTELPISQSFSRAAEILVFKTIKMERPILDLGCGDGLFAETIFDGAKGAIKAGIDISPQEIEIAARRAIYQEVKVVNAVALPYPNNFFATVFSNSSVEHMENLEKVLSETARVLSPLGKFVFLVPHPGTENYFLNKIILEKLKLPFLAKITVNFRHKIFKHYHLFDASVWKKKLQLAGFDLVEYYFVGGKSNRLIVDFFYPFFILGKFFKILFNRWVFPPRWPVILFSERFLIDFLPDKPTLQGPGLLMIARKRK